jgi:hypothetical protein
MGKILGVEVAEWIPSGSWKDILIGEYDYMYLFVVSFQPRPLFQGCDSNWTWLESHMHTTRPENPVLHSAYNPCVPGFGCLHDVLMSFDGISAKADIKLQWIARYFQQSSQSSKLAVQTSCGCALMKKVGAPGRCCAYGGCQRRLSSILSSYQAPVIPAQNWPEPASAHVNEHFDIKIKIK